MHLKIFCYSEETLSMFIYDVLKLVLWNQMKKYILIVSSTPNLFHHRHFSPLENHINDASDRSEHWSLSRNGPDYGKLSVRPFLHFSVPLTQCMAIFTACWKVFNFSVLKHFCKNEMSFTLLWLLCQYSYSLIIYSSCIYWVRPCLFVLSVASCSTPEVPRIIFSIPKILV